MRMWAQVSGLPTSGFKTPVNNIKSTIFFGVGSKYEF